MLRIVKGVMLSLGLLGLLMLWDGGGGTQPQNPNQPLWVCPEVCPYTSIQAAIDAANPGDTVSLVNLSLTPEKVWLENLTFYENIVIHKPLTLEFKGLPLLRAPLALLQAADPSKPTITVASKGARIVQGIIIGWSVGVLVQEGAEVEIVGVHVESLNSESDFAGVRVERGAHATLVGNTIAGSRWGVQIEAGAGPVVIERNLFIDNIEGIYLKGPSEVKENKFIGGFGITVEMEDLQEATIQRNTIIDASVGIQVEKGRVNVLENIIADGGDGILIKGPSELEINRNVIIRNGRYGLVLDVGACFSFLSSPKTLDVQLNGQDNLITENGRKDQLRIQDYGGDLCPSDLPWPPGFKK